MPIVTDELRTCSRCGLSVPETWFNKYKYKGESRRLKHCKDCVLSKGKKLPTETRVERWLKDSVKV